MAVCVKERDRMKEKKQIDMLHGSLWDKIILFALPLAASSILQQLFNAADIAVVGQFSGSEALAAVGANSAIINLLVNLFVGLSVGANVAVASFVGQNNKERVSKAVHTSILISLVSGVVLFFIGVFFARPILEFISTPEDIIDLAELYFRIYFAGMPFIMLYNFTSAILRSKGDTKRPLIALCISGVINLLLNLFFVIVCHMSVEGVAIATVVANIFSSLLLLYFLMHETDEFKVHLKKLHIDTGCLQMICRIGIPAGLQGMVFSISNVVIQSALNSLGSDAVAGSAAALNYEYFAYFVVSAFAQTAVTFIGQNYGAGNYKRCKDVTKWTILLGTISTLVVSFGFIFCKEFCIQFFTSNVNVAQIAYRRMEIILSFEVVNMFIEILSGCLRGIGYSSVPAFICVFGICVVRIIYIYTIYPSIASFEHLMMIYPISWFVTVALLVVVYFVVSRRVYSK